MVCRPWLGLATINAAAKSEVSISTHYKDMKGDAKCTKCGGGGVVVVMVVVIEWQAV